MLKLGELCDRLSIEKIRESKLWEAAKKDKKLEEKAKLVLDKCSDLEKEINCFISAAISGKVKLEDKKCKFYLNEKETKFEINSLGSAISELLYANITLWELEDKRRDTSLDDEQRLKAADTVAIINRRRNDASDLINKILTKMIKSKKKS